jgi:hypothetical protein
MTTFPISLTGLSATSFVLAQRLKLIVESYLALHVDGGVRLLTITLYVGCVSHFRESLVRAVLSDIRPMARDTVKCVLPVQAPLKGLRVLASS